MDENVSKHYDAKYFAWRAVRTEDTNVHGFR